MSGGGFPRYIALKSTVVNGHYMRAANRTDPIYAHAPDVLSPQCKFELENAKRPGTNLFNIRSCWNNKYLGKDRREGRHIIKADFDKPNENTSDVFCTLVQLSYVDAGQTTIRLKMVQSNMFVALHDRESNEHYMIQGPLSPTERTQFVLINHGSLVALPKKVVFMGDNGHYLAARTVEGRPHLRFDVADIGDPLVHHEVFNNGDGNFTIRSLSNGKHWRHVYKDDWVLALGDHADGGRRDNFLPVKADGNKIVLRNGHDTEFCSRHLNNSQKTFNCLKANTYTITEAAKMTVHEAVLSRSIYNVRYRLQDARIYDNNVLVMATNSASNNSYTETQRTTLKFNHKESTRKSWERSLFSALTTKLTLTAGVPMIKQAKLEVTATVELSLKWGETYEETKDVGSDYEVNVPPRTRVTVDLIATQGRCDVPFSYTVHDQLVDGTERTYHMDDGLYVGANLYNFDHSNYEKPLPSN